MYQRYYRQRKFGRIFSIFLVIGSGLSHYGKQTKSIFKNLASFENVVKYQEYFPNNVKDLIEDFRNKDDLSINDKLEHFDIFNNKNKINENFKNQLFIYESNLKNLNRNFNEKLENFYSKPNKDKGHQNINEIKKVESSEEDYFHQIKQINEFRKDFLMDFNDEDRKLIESYLILSSIENKLL